MPQLGRVFETTLKGETTTSNAAEDIVATLTGISTDTPDQSVALFGEVEITSGLGTTAVQLRIRRGTTTAAPLVGQLSQNPLAASTAGFVDCEATDVPGAVAGQTYILTAQQVGGTGAGTITGVRLLAEVH